MDNFAGRSFLLMDKVLLGPVPDAARGVEFFNLNLIKDLCAMKCMVTVMCHRSWSDTIRGSVTDGEPDIIECSVGTEPFLNGLVGAYRLRHRDFDVFLLGNVANSLIPAVRLLALCGNVSRSVMISHRMPTKRFLFCMRKMFSSVIAVNGLIAERYRNAGYSGVEVFFGLPNADRYCPEPGAGKRDGTDFCVVGYLDNAWKGADTAVAAFREMPEDLRKKIRLHLLSYKSPPAFDDDNIIAYKWKQQEEMAGILRTMDVMIVPSRDEGVMRETFSLAAVQGMLTGLPLLVSDLPVLREKVDRGGGIVFSDTNGLKEAMIEVSRSEDYRRKLSEEARRTALERYVWDTRIFAGRFLFPEKGRIE